MPDNSNWNPWKMTTLAILLVIATALVTGLVVASWNDTESPKSATTSPPPTGQTATPKPAASKPAAPKAAAAKPTPADVEACNLQARSHTGDKTLEVIKDAAIGGAIGAGVGAAGGAIAGGGSSAGKGAGIGGVVGLAAGTLYGLNENKANDSRYVEAYRSCMKGRGYVG
jgi:hypothetical protein